MEGEGVWVGGCGGAIDCGGVAVAFVRWGGEEREA